MVRVDLSDYGYVNARVRGMRSHLLVKDFFLRMVEAEEFSEIHSMLEGTVYRREINEAILMDPERPDYDQAFNINLTNCLRRILDSSGGEPRKLIRLLFFRYDLQNIKAILRGKRGDILPGDIIKLMIPAGNLKMDVLETLAREPGIRDVVSTMIGRGIKYGGPLSYALDRYFNQNHDMSILDLALDRFYYQDIMNALQGKNPNIEMIRQMFSSEADLRNISTLVRVRGLKLDKEDVMRLFIPGGMLGVRDFVYLNQLGDIAGMVAEYPDWRYRKLLEKALAEYREVDVVAFDRVLERELTRRGVSMSNVDVLSIGVPIGFMWAKQNEIINLRIILKGKELGQPQADIKSELFFVERKAEE